MLSAPESVVIAHSNSVPFEPFDSLLMLKEKLIGWVSSA